MCRCSFCLLKSPWSPGLPAKPVQPYHSSVTWACHRPTLVWKQVTGSHQELPVGVSWQRTTFCFSRLIAHLCSPKTAARGQLHHADCFTLFFPSFCLQIHNLLCLREPTEWVSVISSSWEQLDWYRLNAKAAPAPLSRALAALVAPTRPSSSSSLHCLNILCCCCPGCHHE